MTREEAIQILKDWDGYFIGHGSDDVNEALNIAVEAIKAQKVGKWIDEDINEWTHKVFCSECGCTPPFVHVGSSDIYSVCGYGITIKTKFCANCGARMIESEE